MFKRSHVPILPVTVHALSYSHAAATTSISGRILSEDGTPLHGANVVVEAPRPEHRLTPGGDTRFLISCGRSCHAVSLPHSPTTSELHPSPHIRPRSFGHEAAVDAQVLTGDE